MLDLDLKFALFYHDLFSTIQVDQPVIKGFRLSLNPVAMLLTLVFFGVFCGLSIWQVNRVLEKQEKVGIIARANNADPVEISGLSDEQILTHLYYQAIAVGRFAGENCFFVENVVRSGEPGLYLYCPYQVSNDERWLLVNMGWLKRRSHRLDVPVYQIDSALKTIEGVIKRPRSRPVVIAGEGKPNSEQDTLWTYFDFDYLKLQSGLDFYPMELQLTSDVDELLEREWLGFEPKIGMHIGYAIHWGVFALVTLGLFVKFNIRKLK